MADNTDKSSDVDVIDVEVENVQEASKEAPLAEERTQDKASGGGFVWLLAVVIVIAGGGYAAWPYIGDQAAPYLKEVRASFGLQGATQPTLPSSARPERPAPVKTSPEPAAPLAAPVMPVAPAPAFDPAPVVTQAPSQVSSQAPYQASSQVPMGDMDRRLSALEDQNGSDVAPILKSLVARLDIMEAQLNAALSDGGSTDGQTALDATSHLARTLDALQAQIATLNTRMGALENTPRGLVDPSASAQALVLAVSQLQTQAGSMAGFSGELDALERIGNGDAFIGAAAQRLRPYAGAGVPSPTVLNAHFKTMAADVMRAHGQSDQGGWWGEVSNTMSGLVTVRRTDPTRIDDDVERALAIAEQALAQNDLKTAVAALSALQGVEGQAAEGWRTAAGARVTVFETIADLHNFAITALSSTGGVGGGA